MTMTTTEKIIKKYLGFEGDKSYSDFVTFHIEVRKAIENETAGSKNYVSLNYISLKLLRGMKAAAVNKGEIYVIIEDTIEDIERGYDELKGSPKRASKKSTAKKASPKTKNKKGGLGKLVDSGKVTPRGNSDLYWREKGIVLVFSPDDKKVRIGETIPANYQFRDMRFLENYYNMRAFEFGNWLNQQDRQNYLSGMGIALFDLHKLLGFTPTKISFKGRLAIAFGARGRGKALAHFEPGSFTINLTRYSRPDEVSDRPKDFNRVDLLLKDGGVGSFAHEYGHALDYYGGLHIEKGDNFSLSRDDSTDPKPNPATIKKNTLHGLMEKLLFKILWKTPNKHSDYYTRLLKAATRPYFLQRNEIFARAFEVYVHYKLDKKKHKNIFLNKVKYNPKFYLTLAEMKKVEKEFDTLINALKKHL